MNNLYPMLIPGNVISFDVYPSNYLGSFSHVRVEGVLSYETAARNGFDPIALHVRVSPTLPDDSPANARDYSYVVVRDRNNNIAIVGLPWIKEETLIVHTNYTAEITVEGLSMGDDARLMQVLNQNGFHQVKIRLR